MKTVPLKFLHNLQENTCGGVWFLIELRTGGLQLYYLETPV